MSVLRSLPSAQGPSRNVYFKWNGNGPRATSYTVRKKSSRPTPSNWPIMLSRHINAQLSLRQLESLLPIIDVEAHAPTSLQLVGRHQTIFDDTTTRRTASMTRSALLIGINRYDRGLQSSLGSSRKLEIDSYSRGGIVYIKTNLSIATSMHDLCPPLLADIPGVAPAHFKVYVYRRHLLGVKVDCHTQNELKVCSCRSRALDLLPAMWISQ